MNHRHVLIAYATLHGQTAKIARRMADVLTVEGFEVSVRCLDFAPAGAPVEEFDGIIIGAPVILGRHRHAAERFIRRHSGVLHRLPTAFFSVSGSAGSVHEHQRAEARTRMESFLTKLGWDPEFRTTLAGAFPFTRYWWPLRWIMRRITQREGIADTTRDQELTDWARVDDFARQFGFVAATGLSGKV